MTVITHPLVQHNLTRLRDQRTEPQEFRRVLSEVAALMIYGIVLYMRYLR